MSLSIQDLRARAIALPGDVLLCPKCEEPVLFFRGDCFAEVELLPSCEQRPGSVPGRVKLYCRCGSPTIKQARFPSSQAVEDCVGARILVRSGSWTGWRAIGGE